MPTSFNYSVKVFDPATTGVDTIVPTISGADSIAVLQAAPFTFTKLPLATAYDVRARERTAMTIDGAENGLNNWLTTTSGQYNLFVSSPVAAGSKAYHIAHLGNRLQSITTAAPLYVRSGATLNFSSKLGIATVSEFARVKISTDGGTTYTEVFSRQGTGTTVADPTYQSISIPLTAYVGSVITVKFAFESLSTFFNSAANDFGWYFDEINFVNVDQLKNPSTFTASLNGSFNFIPLLAGGYALEVRPQLYDEFPLDWGPIKAITAFVDNSPRIEFLANTTLGDATLKMDFNTQNLAGGAVLQLIKASSVNGPWSVESGATFEAVGGNTQRVTIPWNADPTTVYRIQAN